MTPRVLSVASLIPLVIILASSAALAATGPVIHEGDIAGGDYTWAQLADGSYRLQMEGGRSLGVTDQADLPVLDLLLLVPADLAAADVVIEAVSVRREAVPGQVAVASPLVASNGDLLPVRGLEPVGGVFPPSWGEFGGLHTWRGYRLLAVTVHPFRLVQNADGGADELEVLERFTVRADIDPDRIPDAPLVRERQVDGERDKLDATLRSLVTNPQAVSTYARQDGVALDKAGEPHLPTPNPSLEGSGVRYLIVTTEEMAGEFQRLADHRTATGLPAMVVTTDWVAANHRHGVDFQETMRMFLQDAYAKWGVEYLLIGGDTDQVPTRTVRSNFYPFGGHTDIPTDLYFAALDGNWGADGDGWLGEPYISSENPGDQADLAPEISVARAPVRSVVGVDQFIDKILAYETASPADLYANRILYAAEVLFPSPWNPGDPITLDGAQYAQSLIDDVIEPCTDMDYVRMYETDQNYEYDLPLSRTALIAELNTGQYGQFNQFGHGHFFNMSVGDANFTVSDADGLTNAPNFFLIFALNCASGAFDVSCLMESFVENPDGGSIMSVGAAREAFPSNTFGYQQTFYNFMACQGTWRAVDAFVASRLQYIGNTDRNTVDRWTQLNAAFIGDPATTIWNGTPRVAQVTAPTTLEAGRQQVVVHVGDENGSVMGADVCLRKGDETYAWAVTDGAGNAVLTVIPATAGAMDLTVSGANLAISTRSIAVNGAATYIRATNIEIDDSTANGNGLPEAGEVFEVTVHFEDVGGAGATGLDAVLSSNDIDLVVLDGTTSLADVAPGGTTQTASPFVVRLNETVRDGRRVSYQIVVTGNGGQEWTSEGWLDALAPSVVVSKIVVDDSEFGNDDGVIQSGERVTLYPYLKNFGGGQLDQMAVQILDAAGGVTVHELFALYGPIGFFGETTYISGGLSITLTDAAMSDPCRILFTDNYGRTLSQSLEFNPPSNPPLPVADPTIAADAIALRWDPVDPERILGYNVYRAESENGAFVRANPDLLEGIAYFEDRGLQQLTPYWYKVTAVDTFHCESDFSPVVTQGTMPAELENFPLPFQLQTSSHSAVGDVDGDGYLEIILASDEVYAWNHDGSELVDGDDNSQTTGPLTGVGGQFEPAGVVLADLDGEPGLEIIASERANARQIHVYRADGSMMPGWPRSLQSSWNWATPAVGDVDGDGDPEVVVNDTGGRTFVWHHDGTELRDGDDDPGTDGVFLERAEGWGYSSPALFDLDGDGAAEIIFGTKYWTGDNALLAYRHDGTQPHGFPFATGSAIINCAPAIADLDRDGQKEVIFFTEAKWLYVLRNDGVLYPGFPIVTSADYDDSPGPSPAVGNFDSDDDLEILWPVNSGAFRMDLILVDTGTGDGTSGDIMPGWPVQLPCNSEGSPVVGDINGDGLADILQPVGNSETDTPDLLFALNADGTEIAGFPIRMDGHCRSTPVICDLDGNGTVEVVYGSWDRLLHVWDMPFPYDPALVPWGTFQANPQRTGVARQVSLTPVEDVDVPEVFTVSPPYPNPFNPVTRVRLYVTPGRDMRLDVGVFDLRGRRVRQLFVGDAQPGWHDLTWDGRDDSGRSQASGMYFLRAQQAAETRTFKMTLVK